MQTRATIRPGTLDDAIPVAELVQSLGYPTRPEAVGRTLGRLLTDPSHVVAVAVAAGEVVGCVTLAFRPSLSLQGWVGAIEELVVRRDARGRGIGEALLQYAKGVAAEHGLARLQIAVPAAHEPIARGFLLALGFHVSEDTILRWGVLEERHPRVPVVPRARRELV